MARLFVIDERIFNVLPRDVANRIGSPDIRVDTGPLQPLAEVVEAIRQRLATGAPARPGPPVPAPRQGRATTLPSARPTAGVPTHRQCLVDRNFDPRTVELVRQGRGVVYLIAFARALRVPVTGALHEQRPDSAWRYEKSTITAFPGGRLLLNVPADDTTFGPGTAGTHEIPLPS